MMDFRGCVREKVLALAFDLEKGWCVAIRFQRFQRQSFKAGVSIARCATFDHM